MDRQAVLRNHAKQCLKADNDIIHSEETVSIAFDNGGKTAGGRMISNTKGHEVQKGEPDYSRYTPVSFKQLQLNKVHHNKVVCGQLITRPLRFESVMTFIEDEQGDMLMIALYNAQPKTLSGKALVDHTVSLLPMGSFVAVTDPFFKLFLDGSEGIRIDDPQNCYVFEKPDAKKLFCGCRVVLKNKIKSDIHEKIGNVIEILDYDHVKIKLIDSGQVLLAKAKNLSLLPQSARIKDGLQAQSAIEQPQLPFKSFESLEGCLALKEKGNTLLGQGATKQADEAYTDAIKLLDQLEDSPSKTDLASTLLCNRSLARLKLGMASSAFSDALRSISCGRSDVKVHFRLAQAAELLGFYERAIQALNEALAASARYSPVQASEVAMLRQRHAALLCGPSFRVLPGQSLQQAITRAALAAVAAEPACLATVELEPGVYSGSFFLPRGVRLVGLGSAGDVVIRSLGAQATLAVIEEDSGRDAFPNLVVLRNLTVRCEAPVPQGGHALLVGNGGRVMAEGCSFCSEAVFQASPSLAVDGGGARLFAWDCQIRGGAAGGLLVSQKADAHGLGLVVTDNRAAGVEVREGAHVKLEGCRLVNNGAQGLLVWCRAGGAELEDCEVGGQKMESGILVDAGMVQVGRSRLVRNCWGLTVEGGRVEMWSCDACDNGLCGVMVQARGDAQIRRCRCAGNGHHGVFIGADAAGRVEVLDCRLCGNRGLGLCCDALQRAEMIWDRNHEQDNKGQPPDLGLLTRIERCSLAKSPGAMARQEHKWKKRVARAGGAKALAEVTASNTQEQAICNKLGVLGPLMAQKLGKLCCAACGLDAGAGENGVRLLTCSVCRAARYCSRECQKAAWKEHKKACSPYVEHPAFGMPGVSVAQGVPAAHRDGGSDDKDGVE